MLACFSRYIIRREILSLPRVLKWGERGVIRYYPGPLGSKAGSEQHAHTHAHTHTQQSGSNSSAACAELHLQPEIWSSAFITTVTNQSHQQQRTSENRGLLSTVGGPELPVLLDRARLDSEKRREAAPNLTKPRAAFSSIAPWGSLCKTNPILPSMFLHQHLSSMKAEPSFVLLPVVYLSS